MKVPPKVYVVVTAYNEAKYLGRFLQKLKNKTAHFIVVDDGSTDETAKIAAAFTSDLLIHAINLGKGAAMKTGADFAFTKLDANWVIFMDGDDQHDVADLAQLQQTIDHSSKGLALGVRSFDQMPFARVLGNRLASFLVRILFGQNIPDIPSGFKAIHKVTYQQLRWQSNDYGVELEIACKIAKNRLPFEIVEVKTIYHDLDRGMNLTDSFKMMYKILMWRINL